MRAIFVIMSALAFLVACSSMQKTEGPGNNGKNQTINTQDQTANLDTNNTKKLSEQNDTRNKNDQKGQQAFNQDFSEGWVSDNKVQALYSTSETNLNRETGVSLARERLAWLLLLERYDLMREDRSIASRLATSNLFQNFGVEKVDFQSSASRTTILLSKEKPGLKNDWGAVLVKVEERFPELKTRRRSE